MTDSEIVHTRNLTLSFDESPLFEKLSLSIHRGEIVAIVGANGCGKSTILNLLQADRKPQLIGAGLRIEGVIGLAEGTKTALLPQNLRFEWSTTVADPDDHTRLRNEAQLCREFGFENNSTPLSELSDGQLQKSAIISTLSTDADLYLLDEPTNYLDIQGIMALEEALEQKRDSGAAILLVTHDRTLTDHLADRTLYLSRHGIYHSQGGFESVWALATGDIEARLKESTDIKRRIDKLVEEVRRRSQWASNKERSKIGAGSAKPAIAKQAAKMAKRSQAADRRADREIERLKATKPRLPKKLNLSFPPYQVRNRVAFTLEGISFSYENPTNSAANFKVINDLTLSASTQDKLCLMGANGAGKTTLFKLITGELRPSGGTFHRHPNLKISHLPQGLSGFFHDGTLLDNFSRCGDQTKIRQFLGSALIRRDKVEKHISQFSPGELMRAAIVKCILEQAEFLLLDEPTSHLDIESIQVLETLLESFPGGYLMVSHDRSFVESTASRLYLMETGRIRLV